MLELCNISGIEAFLIKAQFRWTGHVIRMDETRLPKTIFYSELANGARSRGGQRKRYKDSLKDNMKRCSMAPKDLESSASNRTEWRSCCRDSISQFETNRISSLKTKRTLRKAGTSLSTSDFPCDICGRLCGSRIGLYAHRRAHWTFFRDQRSVESTAQSIIIIINRDQTKHPSGFSADLIRVYIYIYIYIYVARAD